MLVFGFLKDLLRKRKKKDKEVETKGAQEHQEDYLEELIEELHDDTLKEVIKKDCDGDNPPCRENPYRWAGKLIQKYVIKSSGVDSDDLNTMLELAIYLKKGVKEPDDKLIEKEAVRILKHVNKKKLEKLYRQSRG